jgi:hypothetical protein
VHAARLGGLGVGGEEIEALGQQLGARRLDARRLAAALRQRAA